MRWHIKKITDQFMYCKTEIIMDNRFGFNFTGTPKLGTRRVISVRYTNQKRTSSVDNQSRIGTKYNKYDRIGKRQKHRSWLGCVFEDENGNQCPNLGYKKCNDKEYCYRHIPEDYRMCFECEQPKVYVRRHTSSLKCDGCIIKAGLHRQCDFPN